MRQSALKSAQGNSGWWRRAERLLLGVSVALLSGCAHGPEGGRGEFLRVFTPQVPVFLSGPAAVLLTNTGGFSARVTVRSDSAFPESESVEGELLGRGSMLFFAPRASGAEGKQLRLGRFSYIWNVATESGYVLSDALQAYAPVTSTLRVTKVDSSPGEPGLRDTTVLMNDGSKAVFQVWPERSWKDFPSRIEARGTPPLALSLSKVRLQPPESELFAPPDGFAKYPTAAAMADEIAARRYNLRRGAREPVLENIPSEPPRYR
ncbi:MAG TPA: hypothetical protein VJA21_10600 [Verrucomicrobiae bacterium]